MEVEGALGRSTGLNDLVDHGLVVAAVGEYLERGVEDSLACKLLVAARATRRLQRNHLSCVLTR